MTLKEVTVYVKTTRGVEYAYKTVWTIQEFIMQGL